MKFEQVGATSQGRTAIGRLAWLSLAAVGITTLALTNAGSFGIARYYFKQSDAVAATILLAFLLAIAAGIPLSRGLPLPKARLTWPMLALAAGGLTLLLWAGTYLIMWDFPLTRDEHMVVFDMAVFADGRLVGSLPAQWHAYAEALIPNFLLERGGEIAWISSYLPGNAMLRTLFAQVADPALMNPLLAGLGLLALYGIGRRLFPDNHAAQLVAVLLYATSAQLLATAMTTYAMTAHLALNLLWLLLFLRGGTLGHGGAISVGVLATGLHQLIFHPLFVLPFLEHLRREGSWRLALVYVAAYAGIALFWMSYYGLVADAAGLASAAQSGAADFFASRVLPLLANQHVTAIPVMLYNLLRFLTWQNLALLPLLLAAVPLARRMDGLARPLLTGVILTTAAMMVLLPYQGHGWGYRYLHGLIGSLALLGAYGWAELARTDRKVGPLLAVGTGVTLLVILPWQLNNAYRMVGPYARTSAAIDAIDADVAVVDTQPIDFAIDQVRNRPDLSNRPLRLSSRHLIEADIASLCRRGRIAFVDRQQMQRIGLGLDQNRSDRTFYRLRDEAQRHGCDATQSVQKPVTPKIDLQPESTTKPGAGSPARLDRNDS